MALILKAAVTINPLGTELYIEFVDATGLYDAVNNLGGFGDPNPARNTLAVVLHAVHKNVAGDVVAEVQAHDPLGVASFTITMSKDVSGVLNYNLFALPIFDSEAVYEDDDIVYDNENPSEPFIKKMVEGEWEEVTAESLIGNADIDQLNDHAFPIPHAIELANDLIAKKTLKLRDFVYKKCKKEDYEPLRIQYEYVEGLIKVATLAFCKQGFNEAQIGIEEVFLYEAVALSGNE